MKVILLQDVENMGKKFDVKEVADGYAKNFLIPKKLVQLATKQALEWAEMQKNIQSQKVEEELKITQESASQLDDLEVTISVKVGEEGQLFEAIGAQKIAERLKTMGFGVKKEQVQLEECLRETGEIRVKINIEHNLEAEIRVIITENPK